jgi:Uri superfamily endonuclease
MNSQRPKDWHLLYLNNNVQLVGAAVVTAKSRDVHFSTYMR